MTMDHAVALLSQYGQYALMAKIDLKAAFRLIPVQAADVDTCLPFGLRSAPALFNHYAEALDWIMARGPAATLLPPGWPSWQGHMSGGNVQDADSM